MQTLQNELDKDQSALSAIDRQVQSAQGDLDRLDHKLSTDRAHELDLRRQLRDLARFEYEQPILNLSSALNARSINELLSEIAQAHLVARKQQALVSQAAELEHQDAIARDDMARKFTQIEDARRQAAAVAARALAMRDAAAQALAAAQAQAAQAAAQAQARAQAQAQAQAQARIQAQAQAVATQASTAACQSGCSTSQIQQIIIAAFTPQGQTAVNWGLRIANCESSYNPRAVNPSGAEGLFQFMPSTFANTPQGRAGASIWDPTAQSQAAAWMYSQGRQSEWQCN